MAGAGRRSFKGAIRYYKTFADIIKKELEEQELKYSKAESVRVDTVIVIKNLQFMFRKGLL